MWTCPPGRVLAAVDFGAASASAVGVAGYVASAYGATLSALHAERFEAPPYFTLDQIARLEAERRDAQARAVEHLRRFAAEVTAYPIDPLVVDEPPAEAILHAAGTADLIVMGTHGRRGPGRWWLGSVAERVVRHAPVPVLVTRAGAAQAGGVFERILLLGEAVTRGAARECVDRLAGTFGSTVAEGGPWRPAGPTPRATRRWSSSQLKAATARRLRPASPRPCWPRARGRCCSFPCVEKSGGET